MLGRAMRTRPPQSDFGTTFLNMLEDLLDDCEEGGLTEFTAEEIFLLAEIHVDRIRGRVPRRLNRQLRIANQLARSRAFFIGLEE